MYVIYIYQMLFIIDIFQTLRDHRQINLQYFKESKQTLKMHT